jgi:hypothetical protein
MKNKTMGFWLLIILGFLLAFATGCNKPRRNISRPGPIRTPKTASNDSQKQSAQHPYGNPFTGELPWENNTHFQKIRTQENAPIRMGAFKTTLPDPLPGEESNVAQAADYLSGQVVQPGQPFSLYRTIGPFSKVRGY